jgi:hypothetical protein
MSRVRTYTFRRSVEPVIAPGSQDEKRPLIDDLAKWYVLVLRAPVRPATLARWWQLPLLELKHVHKTWTAHMARRRPEVEEEKTDVARVLFG